MTTRRTNAHFICRLREILHAPAFNLKAAEQLNDDLHQAEGDDGLNIIERVSDMWRQLDTKINAAYRIYEEGNLANVNGVSLLSNPYPQYTPEQTWWSDGWKQASQSRPTSPTTEGLKRYPPNGTYDANGDSTPCRCTPTCNGPCKGECGCKACRESYSDFLSSDFE